MQKRTEVIIKKSFDKLQSIIYIGGIFIASFIFLQIFFFSTFRIPSDSMSPALETGDNILVCKPILGARLFNIFATLRNEQTKIYRLPGFNDIQRNDILVFNFPCPNHWDTIEMHILKYYVKRCIGLPGDSVSIDNGKFKIAGCNETIGNKESQTRIEMREISSFEEGVYLCFPYDSLLSWNIKDFGPLYIPKAGKTISMNKLNYSLYKKIIEWEQQAELTYKDSSIYLNDNRMMSYQFRKNYYFMAGDNCENSQDSRYWGLLPEEYIVGKAWIIWKSIDIQTGKLKWDRLFKSIQ